MQWFEKCKCGQFKNTSEHNCIYTNKDLMIKHLEEKLKAAMCEANACPQLADAVVQLKIISSLERLYFLLSSERTFDFNNECDIKESEELKEFIDSIKSSFS